jgi:hypothetical protein
VPRTEVHFADKDGSAVSRRRLCQDFTGRFVLHRHILNHGELGKMQLVEVYDPA